MGILDSLLKGSQGQSEGTSNPNAMGGILEMITGSGTGGIHGLVNKLTAGGLGGIVSSWIGKGKNEPVEPDQLQNALGRDEIEKYAARMGVSPSEAAAHLSKTLPTVVDKLTPDGKLPESDDSNSIQDMLKKLF